MVLRAPAPYSSASAIHPAPFMRTKPMSEASSDDPGLFEIIHTTRSMRRLKPDPVPDALISRILEAGTAAPSGGNMQRWRFLVVRDAKVKERVAVYYRRAWDEYVGPTYRSGARSP